MNPNHRLANAQPAHQPGEDEDAPHRLAGALPVEAPTDTPRDERGDPIFD
ncbi:hypothetical protein [Halospeciosus flavus]|uniref:Uncharacterized protein n=1 Tax=Halospeciosus flavus TaxID=3032283 RepID=A0ABD5Z3J7_9EURY|nr:hypothetical protein [Halospeciosus flavus]